MPTSTKTNQMTEREAIFQAWDDMHADLPAEHDGLDVSDPEVIREVSRRARRIRGRMDRKPGEVRKWLADSDHWSPHADAVLVKRALGFDRDAYQGMSAADRALFLEQLTSMDDPFDFRAEVSEPAGAARAEVRTARRRRLMAWPEGERRALSSSVAQYRTRMARAVAA